MDKINGIMGKLGGIKVIHNPLVPDDTIFVGDKLWKELQKIPEKPEECEHYIKHEACHFGIRRSCGMSCNKVKKND